jgi:hypothetical protein
MFESYLQKLSTNLPQSLNSKSGVQNKKRTKQEKKRKKESNRKMCAWAKSADGGPSSSTPHGPSARSHTLARCGADRRARAVSLYMHVVLLTCGAPGQSLVVPRQLRRLHVGPLRQVRPQPIRPPPPGSARGARHESLVLDLRSPRSHLAPDSKADP